MKKRTKTRLTGIVLVLAILPPLFITCNNTAHAQSSSTVDASKQQAWRLYTAYKQAYAQRNAAEARLSMCRKEARSDSQAGVSGGAHVLTAGYAQEMRALRDKIAALTAKMDSLEHSWDANFFAKYGPLSDAQKPANNPQNKNADRILDRLNYSAPVSGGIPPTKAQPRWILVPPPVVYKSAKFNLADYSLQEGSGSRGSISAQESVSLDKTKPPEVRAGCLTWSFTNKPDLNSLLPGETLKWTATVTDTSGVGNILGNLKFEPFGMPGDRTSGGGDMFYESPPNAGTVSKSGQITVPTGSPGDKIMIRGKLVAGRCSIVVDEVYQLVKSATKVPAAADSQASAIIGGNWQSQWGPVTLKPTGNASEPNGKVQLTGSWTQPSKGVGTIEQGSFDPASGTLEFAYYQPWNNIRGVATFKLSKDGKSLVGSFSQPPNYKGAWTLNR